MFAQYAPKFIIGGDVLKRDYWEFDLGKFSMTQRTIIPPKYPVSVTLEES